MHSADSEPFALTPAQATGATRLNFGKKMHHMHFESTICTKPADRFDLNQEEDLHQFLQKVKRRAETFSMSMIEVPTDLVDPSSESINLTSSQGEVIMSHVKHFGKTFMGKSSRAAQDDCILCTMLMVSCGKQAQGEVADHEEDHTTNEQQCGALLLKVVMCEASTDVETDPDLVRQELAAAYFKFKELNCEVPLLNKWVNHKVKQLQSNGETSDDLCTHLMKVGHSLPDKEFTTCIITIKDNIRDNKTKVTAKELMAKAKLKMKDLQRERKFDHGKDNKDEQILALQAQASHSEAKSSRNSKPKSRTEWKRSPPMQLQERQQAPIP